MKPEQASKITVMEADPALIRGRLPWTGKRLTEAPGHSIGVVGAACREGREGNVGGPAMVERIHSAANGAVKHRRKSERCVVPVKPVTTVEGRRLTSDVLSKGPRRGDWREPGNS